MVTTLRRKRQLETLTVHFHIIHTATETLITSRNEFSSSVLISQTVPTSHKHVRLAQDRREWVRAPVKKKIHKFGLPPPTHPPAKANQLKIIYTKSEGLIVSCRVTWARSESVNLYSRQIMVLPRKAKTQATMSGPGSQAPVILHRLPLLTPCLVGTGFAIASTCVAAQISVQRWKRMIIAGRRIPLI